MLAREAGQVLTEIAPAGMAMVFDKFKHLLHEDEVDRSAQYAIQELFIVRRNDFKDNPGVPE